jgi:hypothetical protein
MRTALIYTGIMLTTAVYGADPPSMKEGLWSIHSQVIQHPSEQTTVDASATLCRDPAYDKQVREATMPKDKCKPTVDKSSGTIKRFETDCKVGGSAVRFTETVETTADTASHTVTSSTIMPPISGLTGMTVTADMTYISACPAGMKPGDAILPDGTVAHLPIP